MWGLGMLLNHSKPNFPHSWSGKDISHIEAIFTQSYGFSRSWLSSVLSQRIPHCALWHCFTIVIKLSSKCQLLWRRLFHTHCSCPGLSALLFLPPIPRTTTILLILSTSTGTQELSFSFCYILYNLQSSCGKVYNSLVSNSFLPPISTPLSPSFHKYLAHRSARYFSGLPRTKQKQTQPVGSSGLLII